MTLIALLYNEHESIAIGDAAISYDGGNPNLEPRLPIQLLKQATERSSAGTIRQLGQKVVCFGPHMVLWAGPYLHARSLLMELYRTQDKLSHITFSDICRHALGNKIEEVQIIYGYKEGRTRHIRHLGCAAHTRSGISILVGGTGAYRFTQEFEEYSKYPHAMFHDLFRQSMARLDHLTRGELYDSQFYDWGFGGAYEIAEEENGCWVKRTHATLMFVGDSSGYGLHSLLCTVPLEYGSVVLVFDCRSYMSRVGDQLQIRYVAVAGTQSFFIPDPLRILRGAAPSEESYGAMWSQGQFACRPTITLVYCFNQDAEDIVHGARVIYSKPNNFQFRCIDGEHYWHLPSLLRSDVEGFFNGVPAPTNVEMPVGGPFEEPNWLLDDD